MLVSLSVLALAFLLAPPVEAAVTIEGTVIDSATKLPVAGARVVLVRVDRSGVAITSGVFDPRPSDGEANPGADRLAVVTGSNGVFRFAVEAPAKFVLFVDAAGYVRTATAVSRESTYVLKAGTPITDITIRLSPELSIFGRVADGDSGQPVPNLAVVAHRYRSIGSGKILIADGGTAKTDEHGRFSLNRVAPGDYYLEARPPLLAVISEPKPVEDFRNAVQKTYASTWHPGVARVEEALPVKLVEGAVVEGVEIKVTKRRTAAIRGRVLGDAEGDVRLMLTAVEKGIDSQGFKVVARGTLRMGSGFRIDQLSPGAYSLLAEMPQLKGADRRWAVLPLQVGEMNLDGLDLHLRKGVTVAGRVRMAGREDRRDELALPSEGTRVGLFVMSRMGTDGDPRPVAVESKDGSFRFSGVIADKYRVYVAKPPQGYAISEVRYNQTVFPNSMVTFDPVANVHQLDIKLAPASAVVSVSATDGSRPVAGAEILLVPDPVEDDAIDIGAELRHVQADGDGRTTITGLLPGRYRVIAYPKDAEWGDDPYLKQRLRAGQEVRVSANQTALIEVRAAAVR